MKRYRIVVQGEFGELLTSAFADVTVDARNGRTVLTAQVRDVSGLYGLINRLSDFAIEIVSLCEVGATER
ncbi:MAG: hypothetical protein ACRDKF_08980 [Actinomycetota bacterium]